MYDSLLELSAVKDMQLDAHTMRPYVSHIVI